MNPYSTSLPHTQIRTSPSTRQPGSASSLHALFPLFRNVLPLPYFVPYFLWTVVLAAACERSCSVCFALFLPLYAAAAPVYSLLYGWGRSPQLHHGTVFSLFFKGGRSCSFCDYILDSILMWLRGRMGAGRLCRGGGPWAACGSGLVKRGTDCTPVLCFAVKIFFLPTYNFCQLRLK